MREAGSGSAGISFSLSLPRASLTARRHKSIRGSGSAGKRETQDVNIPSHKLHIHLVCSRNPPEKIEQEKWMPGLVTKPKPFSIHKSAASAQIHRQDSTFLWKLLKKLCVKEERLKSLKDVSSLQQHLSQNTSPSLCLSLHYPKTFGRGLLK